MNLLKRKWTLAFIIILIPLGIYTKFYSGPLAVWVNNSLGGILYVIFWSVVFSLFVRDFNPLRISLLVLGITCVLEFLQLWQPEFLVPIRSSFIGQALIGNSFSWLDIFHYFIGFAAAYFILKLLGKLDLENNSSLYSSSS